VCWEGGSVSSSRPTHRVGIAIRSGLFRFSRTFDDDDECLTHQSTIASMRRRPGETNQGNQCNPEYCPGYQGNRGAGREGDRALLSGPEKRFFWYLSAPPEAWGVRGGGRGAGQAGQSARQARSC